MRKLLSFVGTWKRPELLDKMLDSFFKTRKFAEMFVYLNEDDPKLAENLKVINKYPLSYVIDKHRYIAEVTNYVPFKFEDYYEYYQCLNDDHIFVGRDWDEDMIKLADEHKGWRIVASFMPLKMVKNEPNNPTAEIFSWKLIKALGFYNYPGFKQFGCDAYIAHLGFSLGGILPVSGKILHCNSGLKLNQTADEYGYSDESTKNGLILVEKWKVEAPKYIKLVEEANERHKKA